MKDMRSRQSTAMSPMSPIGPMSEDEEDELVEASPLKSGAKRPGRSKICCCVLVVAAVGLLARSTLREMRGANELEVTTWNIAAINNNPFEYWITHDDPDYNALMASVQQFIDAPAERDVPVSTVFTEARWTELKGLMVAAGWSGVETVERMWRDDLSQRRIISTFMKDASIGEKRLASMPDRVTNTINLAPQGTAYRPTVINCFEGDLSTLRKWWRAWSDFMFNRSISLVGSAAATTPSKMLQKIKRAKYPALSEDEEAVSIPLQTLCQARARRCLPAHRASAVLCARAAAAAPGDLRRDARAHRQHGFARRQVADAARADVRRAQQGEGRAHARHPRGHVRVVGRDLPAGGGRRHAAQGRGDAARRPLHPRARGVA
jgi:hypothetical protein